MRSVAGELAEHRRMHLPEYDDYPTAGVLRQARRVADLSQRQLAERAKMHRSVIARIESGASRPSAQLFARLLREVGVLLLPVVLDTGDELRPMAELAIRDAAGRHFPGHLDVRTTSGPGSLMWWDWWYFGRRTKPLASFRRNRRRRDIDRRDLGVIPAWIDDREMLARRYPGRRSRDPSADLPFW
jgi:transcriptional regulator with XRE-family HTH domain